MLAARLPILVTSEERVPIYLQIAHQLRHLIISRQLPEGSWLPPVRELARQLGVNVGTVVQAYRELGAAGLIDGQPGRGTKVLSFSTPLVDDPERRALLDGELRRLLARARSLGFGAAELRPLLGSHLSRPAEPMRVLVVGPSRAAADKYADLLGRAFAPAEVAFEPFELAALEEGRPEVRRALEIAYYVLVLALWVPRARRALETHGLPSAVIGFTAELTARAVDDLGRLSPEGRYLLVTEERNVNAALARIQQHAPLDYRTVEVVLDGEVEELARRLPGADAVIYSFGALPTVDRCGVPPELRLELEFDISPDSLFRLRSLLAAPPPAD